MAESFIKNFRRPGKEFRAAPFWAWNAELEPEELRRQIRLMKRAGLGGFFMHTRVGLRTPYMGKKFMDCVAVCADEAEKQGMKSYLYDEDRWPSGAAGGRVTADPTLAMKELYLRPADSPAPDTEQQLGVFACKLQDKKLLGYRQSEKAGQGERLFIAGWRLMDRSPWFGGERYPDTLKPEAVAKFIEVTHERYRKQFGSKFGKVMPAIFTDEPSYMHCFREDVLPWTDKFPELFREKYDYGLIEKLPVLFYDTDRDFEPVRRDFYQLATELFVTAYAKQLGEWCEKHHLHLTGHILHEDNLTKQTGHCGAAMRSYPYFGIPGIDLLTEHDNVFNCTKQCVSAARQLGRPRRLSEIYGCTGWDFSMDGQRAQGDWQFALGINFRCQHLAWYSMAGEAKRDYPASINFQSPWFRSYRHLEDHFARTATALADGEECRELLVIHPIEAAWAARTVSGENRKLAELDREFARLTNQLLAEHLDFDFGDEELLKQLQAQTEKGKLRVGLAEYSAVLIPDIPALRPETLRMLKAFAAAGGAVYQLGRTKFSSDFRQITADEIVKKLAPTVRKFAITMPDGNEAGAVLGHLRRRKDGWTFFAVNTGMEFTENIHAAPRVVDRKIVYGKVEIRLQIPECGQVMELDTDTGTIRRIEYRYENGSYRWETAFTGRVSKLWRIGKAIGIPAAEATGAGKNLPVKLGGGMPEELNVLVLDHPQYSINGGEMTGPVFAPILDRKLREMLGGKVRGADMWQPYMRPEVKNEPKLPLTLRYKFRAENLKEMPLYLVLESPELWQLKLNGGYCRLRFNSWWTDPALKKALLPDGAVKNGWNTLELHTDYTLSCNGLENLYLLGNFAVDAAETLHPAPKKYVFGDLGAQGLRCYAGNFCWNGEFTLPTDGSCRICIPEWHGTWLGIQVDRREERMCYQAGDAVTFANLTAGSHRLKITLYGSRRNAFGPFYTKEMWPSWVWTESFQTEEKKERNLAKFGINAKPELTFYQQNNRNK